MQQILTLSMFYKKQYDFFKTQALFSRFLNLKTHKKKIILKIWVRLFLKKQY